MTRFEEAAQSSWQMGIVVAFCIAGYLEAIEVKKFDHDELAEFMQKVGEDVEEWLNEESQTQRKEDRVMSLNDQEHMENAEQLRAITNAELLKENEELKRELAHLLLRKSSVTPQRPKGHWLMTGEVDVYYDLPSYECSKCGQTSLENGDYCPNCGCAMIEPQEREEV